MTCTVCPNCGTDLERFAPISRGDLAVAPHEVRWKGRRIDLSPSRRIIVTAIARADGVPVAMMALAEATGSSDCNDPCGLVAVHLTHIRKAFRAVDPAFAGLETVRATGVRWAA